MPRTFEHEMDVTGIRFRWKKDLREQLAKKVSPRGITQMILEREPDNQYDENAISVRLPNKVDIEGHDNHLGYIRRDSAALLAPKIDAGELQIIGATLTELRAETDFAEGSLLVTFKQMT